MKTCIQEWDNNLVLRIPKSFATKVRLRQGSKVEILLSDGKMIVSPAAETIFTIEHLLAGITEQNRHHEVDTGQLIGNEVW